MSTSFYIFPDEGRGPVSGRPRLDPGLRRGGRMAVTTLNIEKTRQSLNFLNIRGNHSTRDALNFLNIRLEKAAS